MFTTDSRSERFLDSVGVKWRYVNDMTFGALAADWQARNMGRSQVKIAGAIQEYGTLMDRGSTAPAPILAEAASGRFEVLDGMQRLLAAQARNPSHFAAYVISGATAPIVKKIRVFANYRLQGGYQESAEWTLSQAIRLLVNESGMSIEDVAEIGGWPLATVRDKKECLDCSDTIRNIGGPEKLPDSIVRLISKNSEGTDFTSASQPVADFCNDIKRVRMAADEAEPYIEEFFSVARTKARLYEQFSAKLEEFRSDEEIETRLADPARRRYQPMTGEGRMMKSLRAALTTVERVRDSREAIPFVNEYFQIVGQIRKALQEIDTRGRKGRK